jgi:LysR family transcriptional regulator for bpeEF and oprC
MPALPEFVARYPGIQIDLGVSDRHVDLISDNVDCVIRGGAVHRPVAGGAPGRQARPGSPAPRPPTWRGMACRGIRRTWSSGHVVVSYLSARSNRAMPMHFARGGEKLEITRAPRGRRQREQRAFGGRAGGLGVVQTFAYNAREHIDSGALVPILPDLAAGALPVLRGVSAQPPPEQPAAGVHRLDRGTFQPSTTMTGRSRLREARACGTQAWVCQRRHMIRPRIHSSAA